MPRFILLHSDERPASECLDRALRFASRVNDPALSEALAPLARGTSAFLFDLRTGAMRAAAKTLRGSCYTPRIDAQPCAEERYVAFRGNDPHTRDFDLALDDAMYEAVRGNGECGFLFDLHTARTRSFIRHGGLFVSPVIGGEQ